MNRPAAKRTRAHSVENAAVSGYRLLLLLLLLLRTIELYP